MAEGKARLKPVALGRVCFNGSNCGYAHGHPIAFDRRAGVWRYCDDQSILDDDNLRACVRCGLHPKDYGGHDPCIANLPGVRNACCGHGIEDAFIQFDNGMFIEGSFTVHNSSAGREHAIGIPRPAQEPDHD